MVSDLNNPSPVVTEIKASGGTAVGIIADVTDYGSFAARVDATAKEFGAVKILVDNAALFAALRLTPFIKMSNEAWDKTMNMNARDTVQYLPEDPTNDMRTRGQQAWLAVKKLPNNAP